MNPPLKLIAPNGTAALSKGGPAAAAEGREGGARSAAPRSARSDLSSAVRLMVAHGRLVAAQGAHGDADREIALQVEQGKVMMLAGLTLMDAGEG